MKLNALIRRLARLPDDAYLFAVPVLLLAAGGDVRARADAATNCRRELRPRAGRGTDAGAVAAFRLKRVKRGEHHDRKTSCCAVRCCMPSP